VTVATREERAVYRAVFPYLYNIQRKTSEEAEKPVSVKPIASLLVCELTGFVITECPWMACSKKEHLKRGGERDLGKGGGAS